MIVGFTGTRDISKVSKERLTKLWEVMLDYKVLGGCVGVVHGGAIGADEYFHNICVGNMLPIKIRWAYTPRELKGLYEDYPPEPPLIRNKKIVDDCDVLIALPIDPKVEEARSGTWHTIRIAKRMNKNIIII